MRVETVHDRQLLCGHILTRDKLAVGQVWASAAGANRTVTIVAIQNDWITYEWMELGEPVRHEKDWFAFQCRYCLVLDTPTIPEALK